MAKEKCLHRYRKVDIGRNSVYLVYKCQKACPHYVSLAEALGRECECDICHKPMIITTDVLGFDDGRPMAKPHCPDCYYKQGRWRKEKGEEKKEEILDAITKYLEGK